MKPTDGNSERGFAVVVVIWGLGLISLLVLAYAYQAHTRSQAAANVVGSAQAEAMAEAGVNIAILDAIKPGAPSDSRRGRFSFDGAPVFCSMPQGAVAAILVEDEGGKVDINSASPSLLRDLFAGFGADRDLAGRLASAVVEFRSAPTNDLTASAQAYTADGRPFGAKGALFQTAFELDQVLGMPDALFQDVAPFVTVHSNRPDIDALLAPPALLAALAGASREEVAALAARPYPNGLDRQTISERLGMTARSSAGVFLFRAEVMMPNQSLFAREAIVDMRTGDAGRHFTTREWRQGKLRYARALSAANGESVPAPPC